ncbi:MAG: Protease HtpX [Verrucomicrobiae bacterium]|nr:Protease HtpX [Verrucomicrobiae bacterium]
MWDQIRANQRRSAVLITVMLLVLVLLGATTGGALAGQEGIVFGVGTALIVFGVQLAIYFGAAESVLLAGANAREIRRDDSPPLFNVVEEMQLAAGLAFFPRIYLIDDPAPNAFAIGHKPENSAVAVTTGLLHRLNRDELQGVIAHEIAHLKNRDVQFMTLAAVMLGSIVILSQFVLRSMAFGGRSRSRSSSRGSSGGGQLQLILLIVSLVFAILGPLLAQLLYFACSRKREYLADACAAQFTRYPEGLAGALEKIAQARVAPTFANKATAPMFIINPLAATGQSVSLFSTHPPTADRIRILRGMAGASFAAYEESCRRALGRGVIAPGTLAGDTPATIRQADQAGPIESRREIADLTYRSHGYLPVTCTCGAHINVPPGFDRDKIHCLRCSSLISLPAVHMPPAATPTAMQYKRTGTSWEAFRCQCGRTVQLSPAFNAAQIRCTGCGQSIQVI